NVLAAQWLAKVPSPKLNRLHYASFPLKIAKYTTANSRRAGLLGCLCCAGNRADTRARGAAPVPRDGCGQASSPSDLVGPAIAMGASGRARSVAPVVFLSRGRGQLAQLRHSPWPARHSGV